MLTRRPLPVRALRALPFAGGSASAPAWIALASLAGLLLASTSDARADAIGPEESRDPGHRVHVIDRTAIEGRTLVAVGIAAYVHGDHDALTTYSIVDDFAVSDPRRLCAVPSDWVIDSPVGALGPRMLRGARAASGARTEGADAVREVEALFDQPEVACAAIDAITRDATMTERHVDAVEDTVRPVSIDGQTLRIELVEVAYQLGDRTITLAATGGVRPPLPPAPARSCACGAAQRETSTGALGVSATIALILSRRRARALPGHTRSSPPTGSPPTPDA